jgi:hypothetical protein
MISNQINMPTGPTMENAANDTSNLTLAGPIVMGATSQTVSNGYVSSSTGGGTLVLGAAAAPSTITLPPAAGQSLTFAALRGPIVVNDVIQNSGTIAGNVIINPTVNFPVTFANVNTYTGTTTVGSGTTSYPLIVQISTDQPFGTGSLIVNSSYSGNVTLLPLGGNRTLPNPVNLVSTTFVANAPGTAFNLTLAGPISGNYGQGLWNNMAGTLTLGSAAAPSTIILGSLLDFGTNNTGCLTVVNDLIQSSGPIQVRGGTVVFTNSNTYSGGPLSTTGPC